MPCSLRFTFDGFRREIQSMSRISRPFMEPSADCVFGQLSNTLDQIANSRCAARWEAPERSPLMTRPSREYEPGGKTAFAVRGEMSWTWELTPLRLRAKSKSAHHSFDVQGIASTRIRIRKPEADCELLATWKMELGAFDSPGCYFHAHISDALCIPRIPSLFVTPMAALEFLLGELFQDRWAEHVSRDNDDIRFWRSTQVNSLARILEWKRRKIESGVGSPWITLKRAKPEAVDGLFFQK